MDRMDKMICSYTKEIERTPLLTAKEEVDLSAQIQKDINSKEGQEAFEKLVSSNLRLVIKYATQYYMFMQGPLSHQQHIMLSLDDLIQEGNKGLISAAKHYDGTKGYKFSTYATPSIKHGISEAFSKSSFIRMPEHWPNIKRALDDEMWNKDLNAEIDDEELVDRVAKKLNISVKQLKFVQKTMLRTVFSLDNPLKTGGDNNIISQWERQPDFSAKESDEIAKINEKREWVLKQIRRLRPLEQKIVFYRFYGDRTLKQIGNEVGVSKQRIQQIILKVLRKLRLYMRVEGIYGEMIDPKESMALSLMSPIRMDRKFSQNYKAGRYKCDVNKETGLSLNELKLLSNEIRDVIVGEKGVTMQEYIKAAEKVTPHQLGYRKMKVILNEPKLEMFFPNEIMFILKSKKNSYTQFNESDDDFIRNNSHKGYKWLARHFYTKDSAILKRANICKIPLQRLIHVYTAEEEDFIRKNSTKTASEMAKELGLRVTQIKGKAKRLNVKLYICHCKYTPQDDDFIRKHCVNGSQWLSRQLNRSQDSILRRSKKIGVKLSIFVKGKRINRYSPFEDKIIIKNFKKGRKWLVEKLCNRDFASVGKRIYTLKKKGLIKK